MLKWIQDEYEAEVVALTVNLGQPGEDYEVVKGKAHAARRARGHVVDAREEFAREYVAAGDQGQRRLRRRLPAVHRARPAADRQARGRVRAPHGLRHDRPRLHGQGQRPGPDRVDVATLAPELKVIAPVRSWQMGRDEEIAYARKHGIPVKGGTEAAPYSIDDNLWGRSSRGQLDRGPLARARRRRLPARHPAGAGARRAADRSRSTFERGVPGRPRRRAARARRPARARGGDRLPPRRRDRRPHRGPHRRPEGARHLRGPRGGDHPQGPPGARAPVGTIHQNQFKPRLDRSGPTSSTRACGGSRCAPTSRPTSSTSTSASPARSGSSSSRASSASSRARARTRSTTPSWRRSPSPAACSPSTPRRASSSSGRCSRAWPTACASGEERVGSRHVLPPARHGRLERPEDAPAPQVRPHLHAKPLLAGAALLAVVGRRRRSSLRARARAPSCSRPGLAAGPPGSIAGAMSSRPPPPSCDGLVPRGLRLAALGRRAAGCCACAAAGRRRSARRRACPCCALTAGGGPHRFDSLPDPRFAARPAVWRGTYVVRGRAVAGPDALWLALADGARVPLPAPARGPAAARAAGAPRPSREDPAAR